jgi:3-methylfumaryl-CoA hydratase
VFDIDAFYVCGRPQDDGMTVKLWARDGAGHLTMDMQATLA